MLCLTVHGIECERKYNDTIIIITITIIIAIITACFQGPVRPLGWTTLLAYSMNSGKRMSLTEACVSTCCTPPETLNPKAWSTVLGPRDVVFGLHGRCLRTLKKLLCIPLNTG